MRIFNKLNHAKNLPDTYAQNPESNNYKILETERQAGVKLLETLSEVYDIIDIENATGNTLDMYGERVGQLRGNTPDEQYRVLIKAKIMRNLANGSYQAICDAICATFNCSAEDICFEETDAPCAIKATVFPAEQINAAGFTASQAIAIIHSLLPVCITLEPIVDGTFVFAEGEGEYDDEAGFTDVEGGTVGGTFGVIYGAENETALPI